MKNILKPVAAAMFIILSTGCGTQQIYLCENTNKVNIYHSKNTHSGYTVVSGGKNMLVYGKSKNYRKVRYNTVSGYVRNEGFNSEIPLLDNEMLNLYFNEHEGRYEFRKQLTAVAPPLPAVNTNNDVFAQQNKDTTKKVVNHPHVKAGTIYKRRKSGERIKVAPTKNLPEFTYLIRKSSFSGRNADNVIYKGDFRQFAYFIYSLLDFADNTIYTPGVRAEIAGVRMESVHIKGINYIAVYTDKGSVNIPCESIREGVGALSEWCYENNCLTASF